MLRDKIENLIKQVLKKEFNIKNFKDLDFDLSQPPDSKMGDFAWPCFSLAKIVKKSPREIAEILVQEIKPSKEIEKIEAVNGYLNFFVNKSLFAEITIKKILKEKDAYGKGELAKKSEYKKMILEFSSPNTNKPQHLGHLRNNVLGEALANILKNQNFEIIKTNLINDRGIHICKSMLAYQKFGSKETPKSSGTKGDYLVGKYYVLFEQKAKENPELLEEAREMLRKWEAGDKETRKLWQKMNKWAERGFKETYRKLGIAFDRWDYESKVYQSGKKEVLKAFKKGICYQREDGAVEIDLTKYNLDKKVLIRADGTAIYIVQDIAVAISRHQEEKFDKCIYITGFEQEYHFKVLFKILELFGFKWAKKLSHFPYGMVFLPEGKMKSREGKTVEADELIKEVEELVKKEILKREEKISKTELEKRASKIALASLKFFLLKFTPKQEINFDPRKEVSFEGATGPYLQYAYARIKSILRKAKSVQLKTKLNFNSFETEEENELVKLLYAFPRVLMFAAIDKNPANICTYLLELASLFNKFYQKIPVLKAKTKELIKMRLILIETVSMVIKNGLNILGIETLEKM
ncbi:MAG: arginyl-tRNA synthetase [Parcubacteria group bacterium Athens1014_10]|nr:MAG: arginyl-tRNA synthetase [Parcubacteria group bacterium Athens1014_10]TSD04749.1 MAG: arginyl-tRNA synthetase [Parcubacteria group bacterium Athens0714_12]